MNNFPQPARLPALLTVEEAVAVLRIGRTKAYAMAKEWRITDGRSGLPVIDLGSILRVPRHALEQLVGVELTAPAVAAAPQHAIVEPPRDSHGGARQARMIRVSAATRSSSHNPVQPSDQLDLFGPSDRSATD